MPSEISVVVRNEEKRQTTKHLIYDEFSVNVEDPVIAGLINDAVKEFGSSPDSVRIKISIEVR